MVVMREKDTTTVEISHDRTAWPRAEWGRKVFEGQGKAGRTHVTMRATKVPEGLAVVQYCKACRAREELLLDLRDVAPEDTTETGRRLILERANPAAREFQELHARCVMLPLPHEPVSPLLERAAAEIEQRAQEFLTTRRRTLRPQVFVVLASGQLVQYGLDDVSGSADQRVGDLVAQAYGARQYVENELHETVEGVIVSAEAFGSDETRLPEGKAPPETPGEALDHYVEQHGQEPTPVYLRYIATRTFDEVRVRAIVKTTDSSRAFGAESKDPDGTIEDATILGLLAARVTP
jgi:hypothetical protein